LRGLFLLLVAPWQKMTIALTLSGNISKPGRLAPPADTSTIFLSIPPF
jgi:hypothetical protein